MRKSKEIHQEGRKESKGLEPIVFNNAPVSCEADDVIGVDSAAKAIKLAAEKSARMIGVIADYGAGKSSLTEILSQDTDYFGDAIHINMWDAYSSPREHTSKSKPERAQEGKEAAKPEETPQPSQGRPRTPENEKIAIGNMSKSFIFQLALGISDSTARHINRRLNRNFGIISFSVSSRWFWVCLFLFGLSYFASKALQMISALEFTGILCYFLGPANKAALAVWANLLRDLSPLILFIGIAVLIFGLRKTSVAYSYWKAQHIREPEINDIFEAYQFVHNKLMDRRHHRLIIIEDLDRIADKPLVIDFIKEIYRFSTLPTERRKWDRNRKWKWEWARKWAMKWNRKWGWKSPVFVISVMPEDHLTETADRGIIGELYAKLFDYTVSLKPIHYADYDKIVFDIIGDTKTGEGKKLNDALEDKDKIVGETLPRSFKWITKGHNLTIRQLKDRLNSAASLLVTLKNKDYASQSYVNFSSCAAVTYLETQYPALYCDLVRQEEDFSKLFQEIYRPNNMRDPNWKNIIGTELAKLFPVAADAQPAPDREGIVADLQQMLADGDIEDDFRMYFYSFPKNSYIKNGDEHDICNLITHPQKYPEDPQLDEKVSRLHTSGKMGEVEKSLTQISREQQEFFPIIIFSNPFLLESSLEIDSGLTCRSAHHYADWSKDHYEQSKKLIQTVYSYRDEGFPFISFWEEYADWLAETFFSLDDRTRIQIRSDLIQILGNDIIWFKELYLKRKE